MKMIRKSNTLSTQQQLETHYQHYSTSNNLKQKANNKNFEGKLSTVDLSTIEAYFQNISENIHHPWKQSVSKLYSIIKNNAILRYNWELGIKHSNNLKDKSGKEVLDLINAALYTPPAYSTNPLVGFPINAILLDFMQNQNGRTFFSLETVNQAFKDILHQYALMVQSPLSLTYMNDQEPCGWFSPSAQKAIKYSEFQQYDPKLPNFGFKSWNEWFLRHFKPGQRPIGEGTPIGLNPNDVIVNSCESSPITLPMQPAFNVRATDGFWLKDFKYSLSDMFGGEEKGYSRLFEGGTIYQAYLSAMSYHHWHAPISGKIIDIYSIEGTYYLDQSQTLGFYDEATPDSSQQFLSSTAARMVMIMQSNNPKIGTIAIIYIGMAQVSSCVASKNIGDCVQKGDHIGNFAYGGSSHAIVFQKKAKLSFRENMYESVDGIKKGKSQNLSSYLAHIE